MVPCAYLILRTIKEKCKYNNSLNVFYKTLNNSKSGLRFFNLIYTIYNVFSCQRVSDFVLLLLIHYSILSLLSDHYNNLKTLKTRKLRHTSQNWSNKSTQLYIRSVKSHIIYISKTIKISSDFGAQNVFQRVPKCFLIPLILSFRGMIPIISNKRPFGHIAHLSNN